MEYSPWLEDLWSCQREDLTSKPRHLHNEQHVRLLDASGQNHDAFQLCAPSEHAQRPRGPHTQVNSTRNVEQNAGWTMVGLQFGRLVFRLCQNVGVFWLGDCSQNSQHGAWRDVSVFQESAFNQWHKCVCSLERWHEHSAARGQLVLHLPPLHGPSSSRYKSQRQIRLDCHHVYYVPEWQSAHPQTLYSIDRRNSHMCVRLLGCRHWTRRACRLLRRVGEPLPSHNKSVSGEQGCLAYLGVFQFLPQLGIQFCWSDIRWYSQHRIYWRWTKVHLQSAQHCVQKSTLGGFQSLDSQCGFGTEIRRPQLHAA